MTGNSCVEFTSRIRHDGVVEVRLEKEGHGFSIVIHNIVKQVDVITGEEIGEIMVVNKYRITGRLVKLCSVGIPVEHIRNGSAEVLRFRDAVSKAVLEISYVVCGENVDVTVAVCREPKCNCV
ncbi:hypothetical protein [Hyperthermus butylicus]|uniref:Uncharacterized protein n=1 Tax=Hyperthermus butylicus (strain DSM 5456 / JCM 9403 / PLM1-5) TaxID=415426 RepID=A2BM52_HYPBU|nr:hypothetical protein [Hyperthermus butylicus]ABM81063.1 hypothetical protein Hbut_1231 [Hyperthermus butylicus DSM 5456]